MRDIKEIVKDGKKAKFVRFADGALIYEIECGFEFPITVDEAKGGTFLPEHSAINLMRWIRKHIATIENGEN